MRKFFKKKEVRPSGYRSGFEENISAFLTKHKIKFEYEKESWPYESIIKGVRCLDCDSNHAYRMARYTPDFFLNGGIVIEGKGKFTSKDRQKMLDVRTAHPDKPVWLLFMRDNKLSKSSGTTYSAWAEKYEFKWAVDSKGQLPPEWLKEIKK